MKYQISYFSPNHQVETLVNAFCQILPEDTYVLDLTEDNCDFADVQLVGFDISGTNLDAIPYKVIEYLEKLDGKAIFLFATVPFVPNEAVESRLSNSLSAFLPDDCDFRGFYLCGAQPTQTLLKDLRNFVSHHPDNTWAKHWLERCEHAAGHPDSADIRRGCQLLKDALELDDI